MTSGMIVAIGFGIVAIASVFLLPLWGQVALSEDKKEDPRFRLVAWSLLIGSAGLAILAFNRAMEELFHHSFALPVLVAGLILLTASKISLMSGSAIGAKRHILVWFTLACLVWIAFSVGVKTL